MVALEIQDNKIDELVLGFPKNMDNTIGERGQIAISFKEQLEQDFYLKNKMKII